jgi:hypothetical protein
MVVHTCNPSTQDTEAGGSQVCNQSGLHSKSLPLHKILFLGNKNDIIKGIILGE